MICAKFGKDLFNISEVIGRKKVAQFFLTHSVYIVKHCRLTMCISFTICFHQYLVDLLYMLVIFQAEYMYVLNCFNNSFIV